MNNDIIEVLLRIKENIKIIEGGDEDESLLDKVRSDFIEMLELMKLFLISERDSYYGYCLMNMQFNADFSSNAIAGIKLNTFPPLFVANPLLLCKLRLKEILYIICHEIDHIVLNHPAEMVKLNKIQEPNIYQKFNLAADASVNDRINYEITKENRNFLLCPKGAITSVVLSKMYELSYIREMENYIYYFELIRSKKDNDLPENGSQLLIDELNDNENETDKEDLKNDNKIITAKNCNGNLQDHNWEAGEDEEDVNAVVKEFVNSAVEMMNEEIRGLMPGSFMSQVELLNKPPVISWQKILKKYVGTITAHKRKTRRRLNRRQPERFDLSGSMDDKVLKIVVVIDTSASVEDEMIENIFNEIFSILAKRKHDITVIECDAEVQRVYKAKTPRDIKLKIKGRGGTLFSPAIKYINKDKYYRDALMIYFTDGYGEASIPKPRTYRNIWIVLDNIRHLSLEEPYGVVLSM